MGLRPGPPRVPQPPVPDTRVYPTLGAGGLVTGQPRCSLSKPGGWPGRAPGHQARLGQAEARDWGEGGLVVNSCPKTWVSCSFYAIPPRAGKRSGQQAGLWSEWSWSCMGGAAQSSPGRPPSHGDRAPRPGAKRSLPLGPLLGAPFQPDLGV